MTIIYILDTSALLSVQQVLTFYSDSVSESKNLFYTTQDIVAEMRDQMSRLRLESMIADGTLTVKAVTPEYHSIIAEQCNQIGNNNRLSYQDKSILSLALQEQHNNQENEIVLLTDDFEIQNTAKILHLAFKPVRTKGIKYSAKFKKICQACGEILQADEKSCPECGSQKIQTKRFVNRSKRKR